MNNIDWEKHVSDCYLLSRDLWLWMAANFFMESVCLANGDNSSPKRDQL